MNRTFPRIRSLRPRLLASLVFAAAVGCSTEPRYLLDSDVPAPADALARATSDVERKSGELVRVKSVFATKVDDPSRRLGVIERAFTSSGWASAGVTATGSTAVCFFTKPGRRCQVRVVRNELDPAMSRISYHLVPSDAATDG
ncbi:MAG: hypothetical protein CMJ54_02060 [Planctomycetaceae bacterium]|nr:hypothetical protein [Planctomycetaceae bacterium]